MMMVMPQQGSLTFIVVDGNVWTKRLLGARSKGDGVSVNKASMMRQYQSLVDTP